MNVHINAQILNDNNGHPAFAVIPYDEYLNLIGKNDLIPNEVVGYVVSGLTPIEAWRKYLNLTQEEIANKLGISQSAYAQQEKAATPRKATREKIACALGIKAAFLDL